MDQPQLSWIANFIWGIADDILRGQMNVHSAGKIASAAGVGLAPTRMNAQV